MKGVIVILMKGYNGKSRLALNQKDRVKLIDALTSDLYNAASETSIYNDSWDCLVASPDRIFSERCRNKRMPVLDLVPGELNSIFRQIQNWAVQKGYGSLILCAGDIPLLQGVLIDEIKRRLTKGLEEKGKSMVVCPSKSNGVSVIAMSPANLWMITTRTGADNLRVIKGLDPEIYPYQILEDVRSYLDLDYPEDLVSALMIMEKNRGYGHRLTLNLLQEILPLVSDEEIPSIFSSFHLKQAIEEGI